MKEVISVCGHLQLQGDDDISNHWLQCGNSGPEQEDVSDSVGYRRTEEHETQLEVKTTLMFPLGVLISDSQLFRYYLEDCKALVFVVDSSDRNRIPEAQKILKKILAEEKLTNVPLMVLANKKDLPNSMTIREVNLKLLTRIR